MQSEFTVLGSFEEDLIEQPERNLRLIGVGHDKEVGVGLVPDLATRRALDRVPGERITASQ
jgi:hypothetical protein